MAESPKNHLLRDFRRRSIFDFCNNIGPQADSGPVSVNFSYREQRLWRDKVKHLAILRLMGARPALGQLPWVSPIRELERC